MTRARRRLFVVSARERRLWGKDRPRVASRFLLELPDPALVRRADFDSAAPAAESDVRRLAGEFRARFDAP